MLNGQYSCRKQLVVIKRGDLRASVRGKLSFPLYLYPIRLNIHRLKNDLWQDTRNGRTLSTRRRKRMRSDPRPSPSISVKVQLRPGKAVVIPIQTPGSLLQLRMQNLSIFLKTILSAPLKKEPESSMMALQ